MEIKRDVYLNRLIHKKDNGMIKVITGIRRCGKSYLLFNLYDKYLRSIGVKDDEIIKLALDDYENRKYLDPDELYSYLKEKTSDVKRHYYIFLDEVQYLISKEELKNKDTYVRLYAILNSLLHKQNVDVYVTGSNSKMLSTDVLTEFRGRGDELHIAPLSFSEHYPAQRESKENAWKQYLLYGGLPHVLSLESDEEKTQYLSRLHSEIYLKDISERYGISDDSGIIELQKVIASSVGSLTNPLKISNTFSSSGEKNISVKNIKDYLGYLQDSFLIQRAERYDIKGRKYISTPSKYYYSDLGLRNALLGFRQVEESHLMENAIYNELIYRGFSVDVGVVEVYQMVNKVRTHQRLEIDFVANKADKRYYIQSALALPDPEKKEQEERPLLHTQDGFKKIIITKDAIAPLYNEDGLLVMSIYDFLLNEKSLEI